MKALIRTLVATACLALALPATAQDRRQNRAGEFDYYVLALSWAPSWCRNARDTRDSNSCDRGRKAGFTVHGLWPQFEQGWPKDCPTTASGPSRRQSREMVDIMGSSGLAWYQWRKHGSCSGLSAPQYYETIRQARAAIVIPEIFAQLDRDVSLPAKVLEDAFIEANPDLTRNGITVTCQGRDIQEVRICLTKDLEPRACAPDTRRDCTRSMLMSPPL